ncbi:metal ABC transporter solute-binding protein, Zn/Mn family [Penaeicola halotolerans]|uniref:metal ABC transporter solute-binding protein, Zn/Mn family n=1 Tax=Penaeicola halotolerans TaxID=2793196 RepID=UPI001CF8752C|nr:zinc ABC transporter substrate-binding protein [Penaeicola halotolerans]
MKYNHLILFIISVALTFSCQTKPQERSGKLKIVATTGLIADALINIVGDSAEVQSLMGPGVDPHLYKATQSDLEKLSSADVIYYNGLHLEGKMTEVLEKYDRIKPTIPVAASIPAEGLINNTDYESAQDPHVWFDVKLWKQVVDGMAKSLISQEPALKDYIEANTTIYISKLDSLDSAIRIYINTVPKEKRILVTAHDAFSYFGKSYQLEVKGLQGISTLSEFGLKDITSLVDYIISNDVKAIFVESSVSPKAIEAVLTGCREKGHQVVIGGSLYSDALGAKGTPEGTYIGVVNYNVRTFINSIK